MMARAKPSVEAAELAGRLLSALHDLRREGTPAYPTSLRALAERAGLAAEEQGTAIAQAVKQAAFKEQATVGKGGPGAARGEALVYFKADEPPKLTRAEKEAKAVADLAARMLAVLESQRQLGGDAYPPTLRRLAELSDVKPSAATVPKAALHPTMAGRTAPAAMAGKKPSLDAPVCFRDDDPAALLWGLLDFALAPPPSGRGKKAPDVTHARTPDDLEKRLAPGLKEPFRKALDDAMGRAGGLPGFGWVYIKGKPHLFRLEHLHTGSPRPASPATAPPRDTGTVHLFDPDGDGAPPGPVRDFAGAFRAAFEGLDRRNGATNFVKLSDLRRELADFGREAFDAGLRQLRLAGEFSLDSHEGLYGSLTAEDREAGVREADSLLIYASRR